VLGTVGPVPIFGTDYPTPDGTCVRDYVHIYDLAVAHLAVLRALDSSQRHIYDLGNGTGFSVREVIATAAHVSNRKVPFVESPRRPGDPPVLLASLEKIRSELDGLRSTQALKEFCKPPGNGTSPILTATLQKNRAASPLTVVTALHWRSSSAEMSGIHQRADSDAGLLLHARAQRKIAHQAMQVVRMHT
jgi:hypothetical protein